MKNGKIKTMLNWHLIGACIHIVPMCLLVKRYPFLVMPIALGIYQIIKAFWLDRKWVFEIGPIDGRVHVRRAK